MLRQIMPPVWSDEQLSRDVARSIDEIGRAHV